MHWHGCLHSWRVKWFFGRVEIVRLATNCLSGQNFVLDLFDPLAAHCFCDASRAWHRPALVLRLFNFCRDNWLGRVDLPIYRDANQKAKNLCGAARSKRAGYSNCSAECSAWFACLECICSYRWHDERRNQRARSCCGRQRGLSTQRPRHCHANTEWQP